jgi:hypothetical protein
LAEARIPIIIQTVLSENGVIFPRLVSVQVRRNWGIRSDVPRNIKLLHNPLARWVTICGNNVSTSTSPIERSLYRNPYLKISAKFKQRILNWQSLFHAETRMISQVPIGRFAVDSCDQLWTVPFGIGMMVSNEADPLGILNVMFLLHLLS